MKRYIIPAILVFSTLSACDQGQDNSSEEQTTQEMNITDQHSYSKPEDVAVKHITLDLTVDFDNKQLSGSAILDIDNRTSADKLILDTRDLEIKKVTLDDGSQAVFELADPQDFMGSKLTINIKPDTRKVTVEYSTSPAAAALQWLNPEQTEGGEHPFLFTQSQAILARTWIPLQDSPGVKFTYDATVRCPQGLTALMSAENDTARHDDGVYTFTMPQPIPSYLMALAVGDLDFKSLGDNCGVFAEPALVDRSAWEFADLSQMISSAEELYGPYAWGRYDLLVLPPSFPFGGMENPRITFATPTIIAGDRSLVALVAHELAHSWSGNLVTNATWNDFWLNEGFTVYFELRIMEKIYGKDYADMLAQLSLMDLKETIEELGADSRDTHLYLDLEGRDPDDGVTSIAYDKGCMLLTTIENAVGREKWDAFLNKYFDAHAWGTMTTEQFLTYLDKELIKGDDSLKTAINLDAWIYGPGLPDNCPVINSTELQKADAAAQEFKNGSAASGIDTSGWTTHHWLYFLRTIGPSLATEQITDLDDTFGLTSSGNSEIQCEWYQLSINSGYEKANPAMRDFLMKVGRRKFLKPIYTQLAKTPDGKELALDIYGEARQGYHAVSVNTLDDILGYEQ